MLTLRRLKSEEYDTARLLADQTTIPLDTCPTCGSRLVEGEWEGEQLYSLNEAKWPCDCDQQRTLRMHYLVASLPASYFTLDFGTDYGRDASVKEAVSAYLSSWQNASRMGLGLLFRSKGLGTGKTFAAVHVGKFLIREKQRVFFTDFEDMIQREDRTREESSTFLIIDEVRKPWTDRSSGVFTSRFEEVIRHRNHNSLPTILTTNLTQQEIEKEYPRIVSLLLPNTVEIDMPGGDYRDNNYAMERLRLLANNEVKPIV